VQIRFTPGTRYRRKHPAIPLPRFLPARKQNLMHEEFMNHSSMYPSPFTHPPRLSIGFFVESRGRDDSEIHRPPSRAPAVACQTKDGRPAQRLTGHAHGIDRKD
jgi:hypothetical protein